MTQGTWIRQRWAACRRPVLEHGPAVFVFVVAYGLICGAKGWRAGSFTLLLALAIFGVYRALGTRLGLKRALAYVVFFATPLLTASGQIGVLTGFGGSAASLAWLGVSFVTAALAVHIFLGKLSFLQLVRTVLQPVSWNSGPCALPLRPLPRFPFLRKGRVWVYGGWVVLGAFFYGVLAAALAPLLILKESTNALDIAAFAVIFEAYVYFNFSGISFMVYGLLSLAGVNTVINFRSPFSARDVMGYWRRWHMSLSAVLKVLFFKPVKARLGLPAAVLTVFVCSALWHGVALNFVLWGLFHACGWLLTYALARVRRWPRFGQWLNLLLLPFVILLGRLIFSESDTDLLRLKFGQLMAFTWRDDAWLLHLAVDAKEATLLVMTAAYLAAEMVFPRAMGCYKLMRQRWAILVLLAISLAWGVTGLGGVYGAR